MIEGDVDMNNEATYEVMEITPEMATEWLGAHNTHNRNMRYRVVRAYAADMAAGNWHETGDSIKRAADGTILDGQHRLAAIVAAEVPVRMLVVGNLPMRAQEVVDAGAKRMFSDVLQLRGEKHYNLLAAIIRRVWAWENGMKGGLVRGLANATVAQLSETLEKHPDLRFSAEVAATVKRGSPIPGSIVGMCHWLFVHIDEEDAEYFFARLTDGVSLDADNPIYVLRRAVAEGQTAKSRLSEMVLTAYVIKAWNAYRDGAPLGLLRFRPGGAKPEKFPEPR